ncbi:hypothetical protein ATJ97_2337 [Georgenia soli]|uniref:Uncharacterized protein n=1 Tax=Georgenia soli TaxID=638953 RepID=A0A2A9ENM5_9MICO|nr:hypothetical protein [Georgenia soli]PFG39819.1 hypothetical protein ATJ97_2337 [Georgenia soli]
MTENIVTPGAEHRSDLSDGLNQIAAVQLMPVLTMELVDGPDRRDHGRFASNQAGVGLPTRARYNAWQPTR